MAAKAVVCRKNQVKVAFSTDNAAFADSAEAPSLLNRIAEKMQEGDTEGSVRDSNGNTVGSWCARVEPQED